MIVGSVWWVKNHFKFLSHLLFFFQANCSDTYFDCIVGGDGEWIIHKIDCPPGLYYDPDIFGCALPGDIRVCQDALSSTTSTTTTTTSTVTTITTTSRTTTTTTEQTTSRSTTTTTDSTTSTSAIPNSDICQKPGLNPDPSVPRNCSIYYHCEMVDGSWVVTVCQCPDGLAYDPLIEICSWPRPDQECADKKSMYYVIDQVTSNIRQSNKCTARIIK